MIRALSPETEETQGSELVIFKMKKKQTHHTVDVDCSMPCGVVNLTGCPQ